MRGIGTFRTLALPHDVAYGRQRRQSRSLDRQALGPPAEPSRRRPLTGAKEGDRVRVEALSKETGILFGGLRVPRWFRRWRRILGTLSAVHRCPHDEKCDDRH
jgi:hypothetical protein